MKSKRREKVGNHIKYECNFPRKSPFDITKTGWKSPPNQLYEPLGELANVYKGCVVLMPRKNSPDYICIPINEYSVSMTPFYVIINFYDHS